MSRSRPRSRVRRLALIGLVVMMTAGCSETVVEVDLPRLILSDTALVFEAEAGGAPPPPRTVEVARAGGAMLAGLDAAVAYGTGGPQGWLAADLAAGEAPTTLTLTAAPGSLEAGSYAATVSVSAAGAANSPQAVTVVFEVAEGEPEEEEPEEEDAPEEEEEEPEEEEEEEPEEEEDEPEEEDEDPEEDEEDEDPEGDEEESDEEDEEEAE